MGRRAGISAEDTRQDLLAATMRVLLRRGFGGARISEIATEAGVTPGSIYNHFPSKAELITAAISEQAPNVIQNLIAQGELGSVLDVFRDIGSLLDTHGRAMGPLVLEMIVTARRDPEVAQVVLGGFAEREAFTTDVIRLAQDNGEVDHALDVEAVARFATMVALGSLMVGALDLKPIDAGAFDAVIARVLHSMQPKEEHSS